MATAADLFKALAESTGKSFSSVEAYGLVLRKVGWWHPTKRGPAAMAMSDMDAAKLLLALLSAGPSDVSAFFLDYANLCVPPDLQNSPDVQAVRSALKLLKTAKFLDFMAAIIAFYRDTETDKLIYWSGIGDLPQDDFSYNGPDIEFRIKGPFHIGEIRFIQSEKFIKSSIAAGFDGKKIYKKRFISITFVNQLYTWAAEAEEVGAITSGFTDAVTQLRKSASRGIGFERFISGRQITPLALALRGKTCDDRGRAVHFSKLIPLYLMIANGLMALSHRVCAMFSVPFALRMLSVKLLNLAMMPGLTRIRLLSSPSVTSRT